MQAVNSRFDAAVNSTLVFSYVGFKTQEVVFTGKALRVRMVSNTKLNEVVVTAFGIKKDEKKLGYSVTTVKGDL
jgi:hypothetical protein